MFINQSVLAYFFYTLCFSLNFISLPHTKNGDHENKKNNNIIKGITLVAPPKEIGQAPFQRLTETNADWVAFVPYGFTRKGTTALRYNTDRQWWGEKLVGVESCINLAKKQGLKIMLKPQVYIGGGWIGDLDYEAEKDWKEWEDQYRSYIMDYVALAIKYDVEMFCIGTECKVSVTKRPQFWKNLIHDIRLKYKGKLTYSANWDDYEQVHFWGELDFIGISSYFPLATTKTPTINLLSKEWKPIISKLKSYSTKNNKQILFTEYGYMSVDGCAGKAWEIEKNLHSLSINEKAQCIAYDALWENMSKQDFWAGGFLWKWFPDNMGHEGYLEKDYTPQNKQAETIIKKWFSSI